MPHLRPDPDVFRLIAQVGTLLQAVLMGVFCQLAPGSLLDPLAAAPAAPPPVAPAVSLERIKGQLDKGPGLKLNVPIPPPRPTFKARVDQRVFVMTLEEALHKEFDLNELQRQSARWAAQCCGYNIGTLIDKVDQAMREREIRKTREQIARELAELAAARKKLEEIPRLP